MTWLSRIDFHVPLISVLAVVNDRFAAVRE